MKLKNSFQNNTPYSATFLPFFIPTFKTFLLLICAGFSLSTFNCCKEPKPQKYLGTYPLGDIKDYLYFKAGSMWVYECDSTGELDTQVMVSIDTPWAVKSFIKYQLLICKIKSLNEGSIYDSPFPGGDMYYNENYNYFWQLKRHRYNPKNAGGGSDAVFFKPYDTSIYGFVSSETRYKGILTNYTVLGNTYDSVRVFQVQYTSGWPVCKTWRIKDLDYLAGVKYHWAKGVGLIKLTVFAWDFIRQRNFTHNWNLKSYNLK